MSNVNKKKFSLSFSNDVSEFIENYSKEKSISLSVAAERIMLKGIEVIENKKSNDLLNEISKLLNAEEKIIPSVIQEENKQGVEEENIGNFDIGNENDMAMLDIFNNMPD